MSERPDREPTTSECNAKARVTFDGVGECIAMWYPQMGGYVGCCWVRLAVGSACFDVWIWHDGEFPLTGDGVESENPRFLHHCDPEQFIRFGQEVRDAARERDDPDVIKSLRADRFGATLAPEEIAELLRYVDSLRRSAAK